MGAVESNQKEQRQKTLGRGPLGPFLGIVVWKRASAPSAIAAMCLGFFAICLTRFTMLGGLLPFGFSTGFLLAL